jgi:hypothetical protein
MALDDWRSCADPRGEAFDRLEGAYEVRVLEPSPPASTEPPAFADDPVARGEVPPGWSVVAPVPTGDVLWARLCREDPDLAPWCADRWLGPFRRLGPVPTGLADTRTAWHAVAEWVLAPARHAANGRIGLRWTRGGFGTPFFGHNRQVRVTGTDMVVVEDGSVRRSKLKTMYEAARFVGVDPATSTGAYEPSTPWDSHRSFRIDPAAAEFLGNWFGLGASVLEELRADVSSSHASSRVQLWPEHFDLAVDMGNDSLGKRANYGASPGDADHPEPYLYVGPWSDRRPGGDGYWNEGFGASMPFADIVHAGNQRGAALAFLRRGRELLDG